MPVTRVKKPTGTAGSKIPKAAKVSRENQVRGGGPGALQAGLDPSGPHTHTHTLCVLQEEGSQVKRSSSPPRGAPKKRTAFIDITNVSPGGDAGPVLTRSRGL